MVGAHASRDAPRPPTAAPPTTVWVHELTVCSTAGHIGLGTSSRSRGRVRRMKHARDSPEGLALRAYARRAVTYAARGRRKGTNGGMA